jgi:hypothetical protein
VQEGDQGRVVRRYPLATDSRADDCASAGVLTGRGCMRAAVRGFLGDQDRTVTDPVYRSAAPKRLAGEARRHAAERRVGR